MVKVEEKVSGIGDERMKLLKAFLYFIDYMIAIELGIYEAVFQKVNILLLLSLVPMIIQLQLHQMGLFELHATLFDFYIWSGMILFSLITFGLWLNLIIRREY